MGRVRLICPLCEAVVADADVLAPGVCPDCGARYEGDGESAPAAVATALPALGADGLDAERVAHALFSVDPARCRALGVGITSDERDGFYRWWVFSDDGRPATERFIDLLAAAERDA